MKKYRTKGSRVEREFKKMFDSWGFNCFKTPLSGATGIPGLTGDLVVRDPKTYETLLKVEVKARKNPPKVIMSWLKNNELLIIKGDYIKTEEAVAIMPMSTLKFFMNKFLEEEE